MFNSINKWELSLRELKMAVKEEQSEVISISFKAREMQLFTGRVGGAGDTPYTWKPELFIYF